MTQVESHHFCDDLLKKILSFVAPKQPYHKILLPFVMCFEVDYIYRLSFLLVFTVSQLQQTLASIQELLVQQQHKIQELTQELATAEVATNTLMNSASCTHPDSTCLGTFSTGLVKHL